MRRLYGLVLLMCVSLLTGCHRAAVRVPQTAPHHFALQQASATDQTAALATFVSARFVQQDGVITSIGGANAGSANAQGQDYLAESLGLWLLHLADTHQFARFRRFYAAGHRSLYNGRQFSYRLARPGNKRSHVNASGDDLRIMRALLAYDEATHSSHYRKQVATIYANWARDCLPNGQLRDFYDARYHQASAQASLAYFDLQTLRYCGGNTAHYRQLVAVVQHGYLGDAFPLYASSYNWHDNAYAEKNLNTSEALETLLELARVGKLRATTKAWLVQRLAARDLPITMSVTGGIVDSSQSVANWALIAQIFAAIHDGKHYDAAMALVWAQQVHRGRLTGGFGAAGQAFSYNNLNVLIAADARRQAHAED